METLSGCIWAIIWFKMGQTFVEDFAANRPNAMVLLNPVKNPSSFGVVVLKDGKIERLVEKPKNPPSDLALVGVYFFDNTVFARENIQTSKRNELEITDALQQGDMDTPLLLTLFTNGGKILGARGYA